MIYDEALYSRYLFKLIFHFIVYSEPVVVPPQQTLSRMRTQRKRRRREAVNDAAFHHTYVMKLFDRSVDLAQFKEDTPLYPVCRAWMANQPRNTNLVPKYVPKSAKHL